MARARGIGDRGRGSAAPTACGSGTRIASRVQDLCRPLGESVLITAPVAEWADTLVRSLGFHSVKGLGEPIEVFGLQPPA